MKSILAAIMCGLAVAGMFWYAVMHVTSDQNYCSKVVSAEARQLTNCK